MSRENLQQLIERLAEDLGLSDLSLDTDLDACGFQVDGKLDVLIEFDEDSQSAIFTVTIGDLPEENRFALALDLLDANYYGIGSGGGTLATNTDLGKVYLQLRERTDRMDQKRMTELLQAMVNNAEVWRERLDTGTVRSTPTTSEPDSLDFQRMSLHGRV